MRIPFQHSLLVAMIAGATLLQGCSDNKEEAKTDTPAAEAPTMDNAGESAKESSKESAKESTEEAASNNGITRSAAPEGASATILSPADGATVTSPVTVEFGLEGMEVVPAGTQLEHAGHHHLLIDLDQESMPAMDFPLPANDNVVHFGKGQTQTELELEPGTHTLQLLLGDHMHVPHEPPVMSEKITITVE
ncbi:DUF4399 domain-containing protein [Alcanivorax sp. NBRC 102024]|uniref:DUF4399 domain-containing protein n=1 Tax=Alcanivorax sp. NBRC 102024 TaxID=1113895 RepID=UPI000789EA81|nr:DUF4399 domain-containing protein [Alcanivorax sp. NBRC 102024]